MYQVGRGAGAIDARFSELGPTDTGPIRLVVSADDVDVQPRGEGSGGRSYDPFFVSSLWGADGTPHENANREGAGLEPGTSAPTYRASTGSSLSSLSSLSTPSTSTPSAPAEETRQAEPLRPRPSPSPRPLVVDAPPLPTATVPEHAPPARSTRSAACAAACPSRTSPPSSAPRSPRLSAHPGPPLHRRRRRGPLPLPGEPGGRTGTGGRHAPTGPAATTDDPADGAHE